MLTDVSAGAYGLAPLASPAEFADRVRRLREEMERAGVDVVVLSSRENFEYFTNYRSGAWTYHARPLFLVIGRATQVIVAPQISRSLSAAETQCEARLYQGSLPDAAQTVVEVCRSLKADPARVGLDYGHELAGRGSLPLVEGLARQGAVVEAGSVIWNVRAIKSEFELELLRATFAIANRAFDTVVESVHVGTSELDMVKALQIELVKNGADRVDPFSVLFGKSGFDYGRPTSNRPLQVEDYIWTDFRSSYGGYPADRNRTARVGEPNPAERDTYTAVRQVTLDVCEGIRAGSTCADAYQLYVELWKAAGLPQAWSSAGRIGHGGGMGLTEPPSIGAQSSELIQQGMVLHIEPKLETGHGVFQCEEIVYIGADHNQLLSEPSPAELTVIQP